MYTIWRWCEKIDVSRVKLESNEEEKSHAIPNRTSMVSQYPQYYQMDS